VNRRGETLALPCLGRGVIYFKDLQVLAERGAVGVNAETGAMDETDVGAHPNNLRRIVNLDLN
jgi:hypothetical protein